MDYEATDLEVSETFEKDLQYYRERFQNLMNQSAASPDEVEVIDEIVTSMESKKHEQQLEQASDLYPDLPPEDLHRMLDMS